MSNTIDLGELKSNRQALLLAELAALLHDVGKYSVQFVDQMSCNPSGTWKNFKHAKIDKMPRFVDAGFLKTLKNNNLATQLKWGCIPSDEHIGHLLDIIVYHHNPGHSALLVQLLVKCDGFDSGADKGTTHNDNLSKEAKQERDHTYVATAFGEETKKIELISLSVNRKILTKDIGESLADLISQRSDMLEQVRSNFENALAETRRSANDVTLWCHSFSTATLFKTALANLLIKKTADKDHLLCWRILRINFDVLGFYTRAIKIADLLGYQKLVNEACEQVKQLIEVNYPLGNEVYRDTTGIYFTFPDISLPDQLEKIIQDSVIEVDEELAPRIEVTEGDGTTAGGQLKNILVKVRDKARQALFHPFDSQNYSPYWQGLWAKQRDNQKWEVCPVCRLRPVEESLEACFACLGRRRSRIKDWQDGFERTIWMDEIADHNGRVALLVGKFGLDDWLSGDLVRSMLVKAVPNNPAECRSKNPSPARLRRVWETCLHFWSDTVEQEILKKHAFGQKPGQGDQRYNRLLIEPDSKKGWKENVAYDGTVDGKPVSLYWLEDLKCFITIINLQLTGELREGQEITVGDPDHPRKIITFIIQNVHLPEGRLAKYKPFLPLLTSPDQFMVLVPAADVLELVEQIRVEYTRKFGKVQNRLPLFLGSVFFQRKLPLLAVIDAGRRMLDGWNPADEAWVVQNKDIIAGEIILKLQFAKNGQTMGYNIPIKMGDGTTDDIWYPYFRLFANSVTNNRKYSFVKTEDDKKVGINGVAESKQKDTQLWIHALDLCCDDTVCVRPSRFAYTFLEQTAQRFRFDPLKDLLLLDELPRLVEMWVKLKEMPEMTDTKLRGIQALFEAKRLLWEPDDIPAAGVEKNREPFRRLVETTFRHERIRGIGVEKVLNGSFERCLDIYLRILRQRIKEEEQDD